ncbi:MAG: gentisate 1,2-dioxygenase [Pseudomonadota bacterium]|nr:gentisate 1,2-dioxygenase [Pseudomonadota bacterium]
MADAATRTPERQAFYDRIASNNLYPLWTTLGDLVPPEPRTAVQSKLWRYAEIRPELLTAGELISAQEAERRVLVLENPGLPGTSAITQSLYAGLQLILPGEVAPEHRHTASALRFVVEGGGAFTAVDGERATMHPGDFIITPSWSWHDHGHRGSGPMVWLDGLDIPIVRFLNAGFAEHGNDQQQMEGRPEGDSLARYGQGLLPVDWRPTKARGALFHYPYGRTRDALEALKRSDEIDACHGIKLRFVDPATGRSPMPTIGAFMQLLPAGFSGAEYRSTDGTVYICVEGSGETRIGDKTYAWGKSDIFVVPQWAPSRHEAAEESVLFSFSDRPVQQALGMWRERRDT